MNKTKFETISVGLISAILLLLPTYLIRLQLFGIPTTFLEIYIYLVFILFLIMSYGAKRKILTFKLLLPVILLILGVISSYFAESRTASLGQVKAIFFDGLLVFAMFYSLRDNISFKRWSFWAYSASAVIVSSWGILQRLDWIGLLTYQRQDPTVALHLVQGRILGPFESPNYLGMFLAPIVILLVIDHLSGSNLGLGKKLFWSVITLIAIALLLTQSVSAILAVIVVLGVYLILKWETRLKWVWFTLLAILVVGGSLLLNQYSAKSGSVAARKEIYQAAFQIGQTHSIFGIGPGNFPSLFNNLPIEGRLNYEAMHPHNVFLAFWVYLGIPGLLAFLVLLLLCFRRATSQEKKIYLLALLVILLNGLTDTTIFKNDLSLIFWYCVAFLI